MRGARPEPGVTSGVARPPSKAALPPSLAATSLVSLRSLAWLVVPAALVAGAGTAPPPAPPPGIPLCAGLTIVTAVSQPDGDYESIKTITSVGDGAIGIGYASESPENGTTKRLMVKRSVRLVDLRDATLYLHHFHNKAAVTIPGSTALGLSAAQLHLLKTTGHAELSLIDGTYAASSANPATHPNIFDYQMTERLTRVGTGTVMIPVIVNDVATALPAVQAKAHFTGDKAELWILDDEANPLALRYRIGKDALDVIKIDYRCSATSANARVRLSPIEKALLETGRADVYSIYFSFNSDQLRPESDSTLREIADVMARHPDWRLAVNGHTDNIGSDAYNLELSRRRATAVTGALEGRFRVAAGRLRASGSGKRSPKDTNDTLEGRARNRRVELVRQP